MTTKKEAEDNYNVNEVELKKDIYKIMRKYFYGFKNISHDVAEDFSENEIKSFINTYYEYLLK